MRNEIISKEISFIFLFCLFYALQHTSVYWASLFGNIEYLNEVFASSKIDVSWRNDQRVSFISYSYLLKSSKVSPVML